MGKARKRVGDDIKVKKFELIPYFDYLTDPAQIKAAQILAYSGYRKGSRRFTGAVNRAAKEVGVNRHTVYYWLKQPEFVQAIEEAMASLCADATAVLHRAIARDDVDVAKFLVDRLSPHLSRSFTNQELEKEMLDHKEEMRANPSGLGSFTIQVIDGDTPDKERNEIPDPA